MIFYYNPEIFHELPETIKKTLEEIYTDQNIGIGLFSDCGGVCIELCTISGKIWTHAAIITETGGAWLLCENFIPITSETIQTSLKKWRDCCLPWVNTGQTAQNIYGKFKTFGGAVRNLKRYGNSKNGRKPIEIYI